MKPGGLCSPTDGSSMPSGDTINSLSSHKSPSKGGHHPETTTAEEGYVDLPPLPPEGQLQLVPQAKSHANGMLPHEGIPNGLLSHGKGPVVPRHVRLPLHGESSREKGSVPCATSPRKDESKFSGAGMGQSLSKPTDAGTSSSLTFSHSLPTMFNKPFQQLSVVTSPLNYSSSKCNAPINAVPSCPGGNTLSPKMVSPGQGVSPKGVGLTSPKSLKSPKGRRKCSLEEMVTKLHNRTEAFQSGVSVLPFSPKSVLCDDVKLKNSAETVDRKTPLPAKGSLSDSQTQSGVNFPNICDNNNTARICDAHPASNPAVEVASTRLHDETDKCTDSSSLTVCDIKSKVDADVSPEKIISNEEVSKSQKMPVLHLDKSCVDSYTQGNRNELEGNHGTCVESLISKVDGKGNTSSLQCIAEVAKNAQWGDMLNQCSSKSEVQCISQNKKCNENQARTDCHLGDSSTSSMSDNLKSDQQQHASDEYSARSAAAALQFAERTECGLVGGGKDHQLVVESEKVREEMGLRDLTLSDDKGSRNVEGKEGSENLVSESFEVISKKVIGGGVAEEQQVLEVILSEPQGNNKMKTQLSGGECYSVMSNAEVLNVELSDNVAGKLQSEKEEQPGDKAECEPSVQEVVNKKESEKVVSGTEQSGGNITGDNTLRSDQQKDRECMNNQSSLKVVNKLIDLTAESESARSSSVELIENEPVENVDSESEIEILYEKKDETGRDDNTEKSLPRGTEVLNSLQSTPSQVLPAVVNKESEALPYLEPISDDENSLLCAPSTSSGLSSVSGFQSNSDTPMFSDTPSDASRGAIMVRISDAVAAILSDVSDESLPDSPLSFSDKTQGSSEKSDDTIRSNTSEKIYANKLDSEKLLSTAVEKISTEETTKDSESLKDRGLTKDTVQPISDSASIIETDDSVCVDICLKSEQLGPKNTESVEKMVSCVQKPTVQSLPCITENEKRSLESPEPSRNICGLAPSTLSKLCSNSEQEGSCQDSGLKTAYHEQQKQLEPPSLLGEVDTGSADESSTSKSTSGITPIGQSTQSSQDSSLSTDKLDPLSSHTQVLLAESCTVACCSMPNNSSHICQNLISGSQKSSSQNQNCNTSQSGGSKDLAGLVIKQAGAIVHNDELAKENRVAGCESGDTITKRLMSHSEDGCARFPGKKKENFTNQSDGTTTRSVQLSDGVLPTAMSVVVDNAVVTSDLAVSYGDNAQILKEKVFSESEVPAMDDQRGSAYSHDSTASDEISGDRVTGTQKHTIGDCKCGSKEVPDRERSEGPEKNTKDVSTYEKSIASSDRSLENHLIGQPDVLTADCKQKFLDESNLPERASEICEQLKRHCHTFLDVNQSRMVDLHALSNDICVKTCPSNTVAQGSEESCKTSSKPMDFCLLAEASASSKTYTQDNPDLGREGKLIPPASKIVNEVAHPLPAEVQDSLPQNVAATDASHPVTKDTLATAKGYSPVSEAEQGTVEEPSSSQKTLQTFEASFEIPDRTGASCTSNEPLDDSLALANVTEINKRPDEISRTKFAPTEVVDFEAYHGHPEISDFKHVPSKDAKASQVAADITETSHASLEMPKSNEVAAGLCSVISELCKVSTAAGEATKVATSEQVSACMETTDEAAKSGQVLANVLEVCQGAAELCKTSQKAADRMEASKSETDEAATVKERSCTTSQTTVDIFEEIQSLAKAVQEKDDVSETPYKWVDMKGMSTAVSIFDSCSSISKGEQLPVVTEYQHSPKETETCHPPTRANITDICSLAENSTKMIGLGDRKETCFSNADVEPSNQMGILKTESQAETCVNFQDVQSAPVSNQMLCSNETEEMQTVNCNQDSAGKVSKTDSSESFHLPLQATDSSHSLESVHVIDDRHHEESQSTESQVLVEKSDPPADLTSMSQPTVGSGEGSGIQSDLTENTSPVNLNDCPHPTEHVVEILAAKSSCSVAGDSGVDESDIGNGYQSSTDKSPVDHSVIGDSVVDEAASEKTLLEHCLDHSDKLPSEVSQDNLAVDHPPIMGDNAIVSYPPVDDTVVAHPPADEAEVGHLPVEEVKMDQPPADGAVADHPPVEEVKVDLPPVDVAVIGHPPGDDQLVEDVGDHFPISHLLVERGIVDRPEVGEVSGVHLPVEEGVVNHPSVDHSPGDEALVGYHPVDEASVHHPPESKFVVDPTTIDDSRIDHPSEKNGMIEPTPLHGRISQPSGGDTVDHSSTNSAHSDHPPTDDSHVGHLLLDQPQTEDNQNDSLYTGDSVVDPETANVLYQSPSESVLDHLATKDAVVDNPLAKVYQAPSNLTEKVCRLQVATSEDVHARVLEDKENCLVLGVKGKSQRAPDIEDNFCTVKGLDDCKSTSDTGNNQVSSFSAAEGNKTDHLLDSTVNAADITDKTDTAVHIPVCMNENMDSADIHTTDEVSECTCKASELSAGISNTAEIADSIHTMSVAADGNQAIAEGISQNTEAIDESIITADFADRHTKVEVTEDKHSTPDSMECGLSKVVEVDAAVESDASLLHDHLKVKAVDLGSEAAENPTDNTSVSEFSNIQDECIVNEPSTPESDIKETISPASEIEISETYPKASTGEREPDIFPCEVLPPNEDKTGSDIEGPNAFEHKFKVVSDLKSLTSPVSNEVLAIDGNGGLCKKIESCTTDCNKSSEVIQIGVESVVQSSYGTGNQDVGNSSDLDSTGVHQPTSMSQQLVAKIGEDISSEAEVLEEKNPLMNDDPVEVDRKPEPVTLCPLCMKTFNQPLDVHLAEFHICNHFIPAKRTQAYKLHMLQRVKDFSHVTEAIDTQEFVYVCRSCQFASKDINAVRFHVNIHEDVYQAIPGKISCECNQRKYSYPFHKWKHLLHCSTYECMICNFYFACEKGLLNHLHALHFSEGTCNSCKKEVTRDSMLAHACLTSCKHDSETLDLEPEESNMNFRFGLSWNTLDNYINYLDGKDFRLNTSSKLTDPNLDRSYLKFPIKNVLSEAVVPDEVKLDPGKDIGKYMKGKKNIKLTLNEESYSIVKNFHLSVQFDLEKKLGRKGRRGQGFIPRAKREDDLFDVLGLGTIRSRGSIRQDLGEPSNSPRTKKGRSKAKQEANKEESDSHGQDLPNLTRTRSGMQPMREGDDKIYETPGPLSEPGIVIDGEWTKNHTYICCSCGAGYLDLADMMDHKWESHPSVWCAHTMIQGQGDVPASFCRQYQPPTTQPPKLPLPCTTPKQTPSSTPSRRNSDANTPTPAEKPQYVCSLCKLEFQERTPFHAHLVECGGLNHVASSKKKNKKGFRFKRRKGQGVPSNRYGNSSQPGTPLKAKPGDRSSGLNTPQLDRTSQGAFQSSGVKRRLELAVGSIDNAELKNRLKAIITGSKKASGNVAGMSSRRTIRMKLRKKALETKRLRKTRHSDRVKENVSKQQEKGKEEGGKEEKKGKDEGVKTQVKKSKDETAREEEKEEENPAKSKKVKTKNLEGSGESSIKDKEKKDKVAGGKGLKDDNGDSENDNAKKITRRRGSAEQSKQSKKARSGGDKVGINQKVVKKKQAKGEISESVANIKELNTKSTSEIVDVSNNPKVTKKKTKHKDVNKDVLLDEKRLQALKKVNGIVGLSDKELQPVCKIKDLKSKTKVPGSKVGRKPLNQNPGGQVIPEVNSQKKISDKKEQTSKKNIENIRKSGIGKVTMLTGKKIKGSRALLDTTIVKVAKKISKKKQEGMEIGVPMEKEIVVPLSVLAEEKGVVVQKKGVKAKKYLTGKKIAISKKRSAVPGKFNTDEESGESQEQNLKYNPVKAPEASALFDTKLNKDPVKKSVYVISSSEETEDESDDSEPEVSRNFRTGRRCGGRMGLRNKRKPQNQRYSFRSCLDPEETENDKDEREIVKDSTVLKPKIEETKEELPLTPKRKRKIANYEDDDDFTYMPSGNSTDFEEESSDGLEESERDISTSLRKRRKTTVLSSDSEGRKPARRASLQRRGSTLTSEGETFDDSYDENTTKPVNASLYLDICKNSKVLIERKMPKKKNMRLQCLVSEAMKSEEKLERLGQKASKKKRESKQSVIGSSEDERKTSGKLRVRKLPNTTDESQESESTVDDDCVGKATLAHVPTKRKKTTKKPVPALTPHVETSMANNIRKYDDDDDDDEDNLPLATIAQLKGRSLPRRIAMSNIIKEKVKGVAVKSRKLTGGVQKHLPRQVMDTGTADSESSGFEGFVPVSIKKNKRRIGLKHKSKITVPKAASENEIDTSSNTELSSSPKPKRKCTVSKKIENNSTEILVSKSTKDKSKIFYTKANNEEKPNAFNMQSSKAIQSTTNLEAEVQQSSTNLKTDTQKTRKYIRKSTENVPVMPVLEPLSWLEAGSETPSTDTGDILSSSEGDISQKQPAKVRRRRSSVEKIKDIPTRSSAILLQETPASLDLKAVGTSGNLNEPTIVENIQPVWKNKVPVPPKPRKRRTKSSHELLPQSESAVSVPQENEVGNKTDVGKVKKAKRKRASSMSNMPGVEAENVGSLKSPLRVNTGGASKNVSAKSPKKNSEGQKRKKNAHKDDMNDLKCVDCGLRFGSVASLEDHQQDCVTIAFEMSLMEAEDHLFECPHCHLTFALKGTQRKHTTSCRLAKSKKTPHRNDVKAMKRMNRTAAAPQDPLLPDAADSSLVANPCQGSPIKSRRRSKENVASDEGVNAASPLKDSFKQNFVNISEVADKSDSEKQLEKSKRLTPVPYSKSNSKVRKELQTNGQLENFEGVDLFCLTKIDGVQKCLVCGYEVSDKESVEKHRLLQQFTHHCQQKTVVEVCALLTNYNLSIDTVRTLITSASILHGSTVLSLDAKQQSYAESNSVTTVSANSCVLQLKELLTSPHCTRILSVLDTIASHHRTSRTVSISGTRQEALKAVTALEELLKEMSEIDNSIKKNRMLKSMRETFEAGTIN